MFTAAHLTLIQVYPFPEPVFQPESLARLGLWARLTRRNRRNQTHLALFNQRASLRSWLRYGNPVLVPNLGVMKALRKPDLPYDQFYRPFFQPNREVDSHLRLQHGPMPFYPIQILLHPDYADLRWDADAQAAIAALVGQPLKSCCVTPMLVVYPAGCISVQYRLFLETAEPLASDSLNQLLRQWDELPWQIRHRQANRRINGLGPSALLDHLAQRLHQELVKEEQGSSLDLQRRQTFTLVNLQGTLHDAGTGTRHNQAQRAMTQLAGVAYEEAGAATVWGAREDEATPWLILGKERLVMAVDDAVRQHTARYRTDNKILEARRALRNRAISTVEMALALRVLYTWYADWLIAEQRAWTLEPLQGRFQRLLNFVKQPQLDGRIYGTLFYEIAYIQEHLRQADPKNATLWMAVFKAILNKTDRTEGELTQLIDQVHEAGQTLLEEVRKRQEFQLARAGAALEAMANLKALLEGAVVPGAAPALPATP